MTIETTLDVYNHLRKIYVLLEDGDRAALGELDLTLAQYHRLTQVGNYPKNELTVSALATILACTPSNVTRMVQRLEDQGLIRKVRSRTNQRLVDLSLTPTGKRMLQVAERRQRLSVKERFAAWKVDDLQILNSLTYDIIHVLEKKGGEFSMFSE